MPKVTVELVEPIELPGREPVTKITMKTLKVKHLKRLARSRTDGELESIDEALAVIKDRSGWDDEMIGELDAADMEKIIDELGKSPATGPTS